MIFCNKQVHHERKKRVKLTRVSSCVVDIDRYSSQSLYRAASETASRTILSSMEQQHTTMCHLCDKPKHCWRQRQCSHGRHL